MPAHYENRIELYSITRIDKIKNDDLIQKDVIRNG